MGETKSCSACCGLFNLKANDTERREWIAENTKFFLALDLSSAANIVNYRKEREAVTLPQRVREDIYVCPFIGDVGGKPGASLRTGCLLHPQGSPHPQIGLWPHPQNFSFYGEGICLSYDCLAKERKVYQADFFLWAETASVFDYGRLASDHTLHRTLAILPIANKDLSVFYSALVSRYAEFGVVTTSFEDIEKTLPETLPDLCLFLGRRIDPGDAQRIAGELLAAATG
jgi:hypothetical protein